MVNKSKDEDVRHLRKERWNLHLSAIMSAAERLIRPPLGCNEKLSRFLRRAVPLFERLGHVSEDQFFELLEGLAVNSQKLQESDQKLGTDIENMSLEEVESWLADSTLTKSQLLDIVRYRFHGPTGTLTKLPRNALIERINTFVMNERGHHTVARLAAYDEVGGIRTEKTSEHK